MMKILLVEDNEEILESTAELLELKGFSVQVARNGEEGMHKALKNPPDLVISDIMMPKMDGYALLETLRSEPDTAMIPFIFLTAKAQKKDILLGAVSGADRYLTKPFSMADLEKNINEIKACRHIKD